MTENKVKSRIENNQPCFGVISPTTDPTICEYIGFTGLDFYMIDGEHGAISASDVNNIVRGCEVSGTMPFARIRSVDEKLILQYLDAGVMGVMMPSIDNVADVEKLVRAIKYPPLGNRGLGPVRSSDYMQGKMTQQEYVEYANDQILIMPQIESMSCVDNLEAICQVEGVDGFIIGPRDLAMSMGFTDGPGHPEVKEMLDHIFKTVLENGKFFGTVAGNAERATELIDMGASIILNSVQGLIKVAGKQFLAARK